ncbi:hypothetical protein JQ609_32515 [Bradyrhizobium sp. AUGA SZCCT0169]|uniref:hypothetical protein n=1 Tax=Bradyrhizobium sp. AUGA SZCCT0169 TaxID=2807663 RepID=UPI001BAA646E|nr:hypothetical protein [Bradyrhizobium sp. AUGA SZCCT0169]MBR1251625.1 hypothetical protein [Bradyrhizobium sp. AUGA SZCCT0169]
MRTSILAITVAFGTAIAVPALAQQSPAPGQPQMQSDKQLQEEADKGIKTRDSGESGFVGQQEKPGASAHPPGQPGQTTTGSGAGTSGSRGSETGASPR